MRALELIDSDLNARRAFPPAGAVWQSPQRPHTVGKPAQTRRVSLPPSHGPSRRSAPAPRTRGGGGRGLSGGALSGSTSGGGTSGGALRGGGSTSGAACWCCAGRRRVLAPSRVRAAGRAPHARVSSASRTTRRPAGRLSPRAPVAAAAAGCDAAALFGLGVVCARACRCARVRAHGRRVFACWRARRCRGALQMSGMGRVRGACARREVARGRGARRRRAAAGRCGMHVRSAKGSE